MTSVIHLIYTSTESVRFRETDLVELLARARTHNATVNVTGMLLYSEGSFFQILEGEAGDVDELFEKIAKDHRHGQVVTIIREPIAKRSFGEWTMGYANLTPDDLGRIVGLNDFFSRGSCFERMDRGRAKKLLAAFREGRWRSKVAGPAFPPAAGPGTARMHTATMTPPAVSFAYQPIIDAGTAAPVAFEALVRGTGGESSNDVLIKVPLRARSRFDADCRAIAIATAAGLGITCNLHLNFMAVNVDDASAAIRSTLDAAERNGLDPRRIVLEVDQDTLIGDAARFAAVVETYRGAGVQFSIDHFGAGHAGLNLLEPYRPELIALNVHLVRDIESNGPRQAIVRGLTRTCDDLGVEIIAKHIETVEEYGWFREEGIALFQGNLFAEPGFECLPTASFPKSFVAT